MFVVCVELGVDVAQAGPAVVGPEPVSDAAVPAGHAQVGPTGHEDGDDARARVAPGEGRLDRPVQVGVGRRGRGGFTEEALDMHVVREVAEGRHDGRVHVVIVDAWQRTNVQLEGGVGGHDVDGSTRAGDRLGNSHVGDGVREGRQVPELGVVALVGAVDETCFGRFLELEGAHKPSPDLVRSGGPASGGQRRAHLGEPLDGARAAQRHRAVARVAADVQAALGGTLFAEDHDDVVASPTPTNVGTAHFGEGRVPREGVRPVVADPRDAQSSSCFLVGGGHEHQRTRGRLTLLGAARDLAGHDGHRGG